MALFGKKNEEPAAPMPASDVPTSLVMQMRSQNFSDNQIVQALQRDGYSANQIFDAMNQADLQSSSQSPMQPDEGIPSIPEFNQPAPMMMPQMAPAPEADREHIEEIAESIIDEKWEEFMKNLNKIIEWKDRTEARMTQLDQQFKDLQHNFDNLHKAMIGKIGEYDQNILNVGVEIKAMERVFQKVLPTLTDNVNELSKVTQTLKESKDLPKKK